jgi:hypothetical protein
MPRELQPAAEGDGAGMPVLAGVHQRPHTSSVD